MANGININDVMQRLNKSNWDKNNDGNIDKQEGAAFLFSDEGKSIFSAYL